MQEGTSIGLFTIVSMLGFGMLFGIMLLWLPRLQGTYLGIIENGVNEVPHYTG